MMPEARLSRAARKDKAMKKPDLMEMPVHDESPPANIGRTDITPKSGFILEVDGRMKDRFESESEAMAKAVELKSRFPMIQVKIYDAVEKTRSMVPTAVDDPLEGRDGETPDRNA